MAIQLSLVNYLDMKIGIRGSSAAQIIKILEEEKCEVMAYGGFIRDLLYGLPYPNDLDIVVYKGNIRKIAQKYEWPYELDWEGRDFIRCGKLDISSFSSSRLSLPPEFMDYLCNYACYSFRDYTLTSRFPESITDARDGIIRIPPVDFDLWSSSEQTSLKFKKHFRFWKLKAMGFTPQTPDLSEKIVGKILEGINENPQNVLDSVKAVFSKITKAEVFSDYIISLRKDSQILYDYILPLVNQRGRN